MSRSIKSELSRREFVAMTAGAVLVELKPLQAQEEDLAARLARAFDAIQDAVAASPIAGIAVGITDRKRALKIATHGFADLKTKVPITADSLFEIGSVSKSFTAIALMQLAQEGKFDPHAPITKYLPWFEVRSKFAPITGHHLLTHTSGLPNYRPDLASTPFATFALRDFEVSYAPGSHYWYSNIGFQTLGYVLENIERASYRTIVSRRILAPLGMTATAAIIDDDLRSRLPVSYRVWPYTNDYVEEPWFEYRAADGSIASTINDMLAYVRLFLNRGAATDGRLLAEDAFTRLTTPALNDYAYGLTVHDIDGDTVVSHEGSIAAFNSVFEAHMKDGFGVVVLGNAQLNRGLNGWMVNTIKAAVRDQPFPKLPVPPSPEQTAAAAAEWAGVYTGPAGKSVEFVATDHGLALKRGDSTLPLRRIGRDSFRSDARDLIEFPFAFERDGEKVVAVSHGPDWYTGKDYTGPREFKIPAEYLPFAGRYENHNPEGQFVRVFIRKGQLILANGRSEGSPLAQIGPGLFRPTSPDYNPERYRFDTVIDGHALRLLMSGMPMYRIDEN